MNVRDEIEIISNDLFKQAPGDIATVDYLGKLFEIAIGWHYPLDFVWIYNKVKDLPKNSVILDAGAARGLMQFILAYNGYDVISVDFMKRTPPAHITGIIRINEMDDDDVADHEYLKRLQKAYGSLATGKAVEKGLSERLKAERFFIKTFLFKRDNYLKEYLLSRTGIRKKGTITYYRADFTNMKRIPDASVDCVVSVSALEHNDNEGFRKAVREFDRILKPGGRMAITTSAAKEDYYHKQSMGWCYGEKTLAWLFGLKEGYLSNYDKYDELMDKLKSSRELESRLADFYKKSGDNGMPWGKWDPKYQPVGVLKFK